MSPVALNSCHNTTSSTGDDHRRIVHRWVPQIPPTVGVAAASATVWVEPLTIAQTVADELVVLKGLTPCEGKTAPDQAPRTTMRMRFPLLRNAVVRFGERIIEAAADGGSLDAEGNRPHHLYLA